MEAVACPYHTMAHCLSVRIVFTLVVPALLLEARGSSIGQTMNRRTGSLKNSEFNVDYQGSSFYPGGVVYTVGSYYPGVSGYYPTSAEGGQPEVVGGYPVGSERGEGKISGAVPVDDEVEVFNVPQSNTGRGQPDGRYPRVYPHGGYPSLYPSGWYPAPYPSVG